MNRNLLLLRSMLMALLLVIGAQGAMAWSDFAINGNFGGGSSWAPIYLQTKVNDNHFTGTIDASSWQNGKTYEFKFYNEENSGSINNYWGSSTYNIDFTTGHYAIINEGNNSGNMTWKHNSAYSSYTIDAEYITNYWHVTITGVSSSHEMTATVGWAFKGESNDIVMTYQEYANGSWGVSHNVTNLTTDPKDSQGYVWKKATITASNSDVTKIRVQPNVSGANVGDYKDLENNGEAAYLINFNTSSYTASLYNSIASAKTAEGAIGKHSFTVYASVNNDFAWFPSDADNNEGCQAHGEDFYIFAYLTSDNNWSGYGTKSDVTYTKLTNNDFAPSKSTMGENNTYGDYWDGLEYPVYNDIRKQTFKRAKFTIYYDAALDGQTMFFTVNNGRGGKDGVNGFDGDGCLRLVCANKSYRGDASKTLPYSYEWPSVTLEDGGKYYMLLDFHTHEHEAGYLDYGYYTNATVNSSLSLGDIGQRLFTNITYDDDFVANNGDASIGADHSGQTFYEYETTTSNGQTYYTKLTNYWEQGKDYNVDFYRPFYSDGAYETICLPFDVTSSEVEEYFGNDTQLYRIIGVTPTEICVTSESSITAGIPYLIIPTIQDHTWNAGAENGEAIKFIGREMKIAYNAGTISDTPLPYTKDDKDETFTFKGCVLPVSLGSRDRFFNTSGTSASNSKLIYSQAYADRQVIRATRCFFTDTADPEVETNHDGQPINKVKAKRIRIDGFDDEDLATKVISLDGYTLKAVNDTNIYNMSGQRIAGSINSLSKGIYIIGGKKFAVK